MNGENTLLINGTKNVPFICSSYVLELLIDNGQCDIFLNSVSNVVLRKHLPYALRPHAHSMFYHQWSKPYSYDHLLKENGKCVRKT